MLTYSELDVPLDSIDRPARPSRLELTHDALGELADDMAQNGLLQRVGLAGPSPKGRYVIGWGDRRCAAARLLLWPTIAAKVYPHGTDMLLLKAAENEQREQLTPLEQAMVVQEMLDTGRPRAEVARLLRRSPAWIDARLELLALPEELRQAVHEGRLPMNVATALGAIDHADYRRELIGEAERTGASVSTVHVWTAHYQADRDRIVQNHLTVQEIKSARSAYVVYYPCDVCGREVPYQDTRGLRICLEDAEQLAVELAAARAGTSEAAPPPR